MTMELHAQLLQGQESAIPIRREADDHATVPTPNGRLRTIRTFDVPHFLDMDGGPSQADLPLLIRLRHGCAFGFPGPFGAWPSVSAIASR